MCTLTWKPLKNGYMLFFNRDESRTRAAALAPQLNQNQGIQYLSPIDSTRGGTWLLVNAHGISVGLLNNYAAGSTGINTGSSVKGLSSRGMLPLACSACSSVSQAIAQVKALQLSAFPSFHLVVMSSTEAMILSWDGRKYNITALDSSGVMLTTSAFQPDVIAQARKETFSRLVGEIADATPEQLQDFHWHEGNDGATGIRMSREEACTHSISHITVSLDENVARFHYSPLADISPDDTSVDLSLGLIGYDQTSGRM